MPRFRHVAPLALCLITSCMSNSMVVQNTAATAPGGATTAARPSAPTPAQIAQAQLQHQVAQPCILSIDERGYVNAIFVNKLTVQPQLAQQQRVDGCAGAKFRLDMNGRATDLVVIREYPPNYGYGDALTQEIRGSTFKPPIDTNQWYYMALVEVFNKNVSGQ